MGAYFLRSMGGDYADPNAQPDPSQAPLLPDLSPPPPNLSPMLPTDHLGGLADQLGSLGTNTTGDDRRDALRQALIQSGLTIASHAGTQGLGALAPGLLTGMASYKSDLQQVDAQRQMAAKEAAAEEDRKARLAIDQGRYQQESVDRQAALSDKSQAAAAILQNKKDALARHTAMLDKIKDPDLKDQLAPLAGDQTGAFEKAYATAIKPESTKQGIQIVRPGETLYDLDTGKPRFSLPPARVPSEPGWEVVKQDDGTLMRVNKITGQASPVQTPPLAGLAKGEKAEVRQDELRIWADNVRKLTAAGKDYDSTTEMQKAHDAATQMLLQRKAAGPPALAPKAAPVDLATVEARIRQRLAGQPESAIQAALADVIKRLVP